MHELDSAIDTAPLLPGFADPVMGAQRTFRALLDALSRPGTVVPLARAATRFGECEGAETACPPGLSIAMTAALLTLVDSDTPLWLPTACPEATRRFIRFHCACPIVDDPAHARFIAVPRGYSAPALAECDQGDPRYPDRSSTLLIDVHAMVSAPPAPQRYPNAAPLAQSESADDTFSQLTLRGPGIAETQALAIVGAPVGFWQQWQQNKKQFPLGVDAVFCANTSVCGLPRTTHVEA